MSVAKAWRWVSLPGETWSAAGSTIAVTTSTTYEAHLLGFTRTVTGHAEARIARSVEGTEQ